MFFAAHAKAGNTDINKKKNPITIPNPTEPEEEKNCNSQLQQID